MRTEHINERESSFQASQFKDNHAQNVLDFYLETATMVEKVHRLFGEAIERELSRLSISDINAVQAVLLFKIGKDRLIVNELLQRNYYLGSNVSYSLHKMIESGYISKSSVPSDRRSVCVSLSFKGFELFKDLQKALKEQALLFEEEVMMERDPETLLKILKKMEWFLASLVQER